MAGVGLEADLGIALGVDGVGVGDLEHELAVDEEEAVAVDAAALEPVDAAGRKVEQGSAGDQLVFGGLFKADLAVPPAFEAKDVGDVAAVCAPRPNSRST